jgi:hypothetical protein
VIGQVLPGDVVAGDVVALPGASQDLLVRAVRLGHGGFISRLTSPRSFTGAVHQVTLTAHTPLERLSRGHVL